MSRFFISVWFLLMGMTSLSSKESDEKKEEIPQLGRPTDLPFSEGSGSFRVETDVDREIVQVDEPILLFLRVIAIGPVHLPPQRIDLQEIPGFASQFRLESVDRSFLESLNPVTLISPGLGRPWSQLVALAPPVEWEFVYRLRPRSRDVQAIPDVPFAFYNPVLRRFQVQYADRIAIEVRPADQVEMELKIPPWAEKPVTGDQVRYPGFQRQIPGQIWLLVPPLICLTWYVLWFLLYPDQVRQLQRRKRRAVRLALGILAQKSNDDRKRARLASTALTQYLHLRHGFPQGEPVPAEVIQHLQSLHFPQELLEKTERFLEDCAAMQFRPRTGTGEPNPATRATDLILELEEQS